MDDRARRALRCGTVWFVRMRMVPGALEEHEVCMSWRKVGTELLELLLGLAITIYNDLPRKGSGWIYSDRRLRAYRLR